MLTFVGDVYNGDILKQSMRKIDKLIECPSEYVFITKFVYPSLPQFLVLSGTFPHFIGGIHCTHVHRFRSVSVSPKHVVDVSHGHILGLGQRAPDQGQGGQHEAAAEVEGSPQVEAGLQQREQLEAHHHQEEAQGPGQPLHKTEF